MCFFPERRPEQKLKSGVCYLLYKSEWFAPLCVTVTVTVTVCHCCLEVELWLKCCAKLNCYLYYLGLPLKVLLENTFVVLTVLTVLTVAAPAPAVP